MSLDQRPSRDLASVDELTLFAHRRTAIDLIATMRARMIRCALFGTYLQRPNPTRQETEADRAEWRSKLAEQYAGMERAWHILHGHDPEGVVPDDVCTWIADCATLWPEYMGIIERMRGLTHDIVTAANTGGDTLNRALKAHYDFARIEFFHAITAFCDGLWAQLDEQRHEEMHMAKHAADAITQTLNRLERIGKHVKLVSLNASVEAGRVGEAGKGLGVIAVEFKTLAEEIQSLAVDARANIAALANDTHQT